MKKRSGVYLPVITMPHQKMIFIQFLFLTAIFFSQGTRLYLLPLVLVCIFIMNLEANNWWVNCILWSTATYDEICGFLTSVAVDQRSQDIYVPKGLKNHNNISTLIEAATDNFDQNKDTLDGKSTTQAMAAVVYKNFYVVLVHRVFYSWNEKMLRKILSIIAIKKSIPNIHLVQVQIILDS